MGSDEKLVRRFLNDRMHITAEDCDKLLRSFGYELRKGSGSHRVYHKKGDLPITVVDPKNHKYVKPGYVDLLVKRLNLEGLV